MMGYRTSLKRIAILVAAIAGTGGCAHQAGWHGSVNPVERVDGRNVAVGKRNLLQSARQDFRQGRVGLAARKYQQALAGNPRAIRALNGLGACYDRLKRYRLAQAYYYRALNLDGDSVQTLNNLGYSMVLQERYDEAIQVLTTASEIDGGNGAVRRNLALAQNRLFAGLEPNTQELPASRKRVVIRKRKTEARPQPEREAPEPAVRETREPPPADYSVEVANGNGRNGMAYLVSRYLTSNKIQVQDISNARHFDFGRTRIYFRPGFKAAAERVARLLQIPARFRQTDGEGKAEIRIVLGRDFLMYERHLRSAALEDARHAAGSDEPDGPVAHLAAALEVANGNGRNGMAALVGKVLGREGSQVARISNAESFAVAETTVYYRPGGIQEAKRIAESLPVAAVLQESGDMRDDIGVRVVLGRDLLAHVGQFKTRLTDGHA